MVVLRNHEEMTKKPGKPAASLGAHPSGVEEARRMTDRDRQHSVTTPVV